MRQFPAAPTPSRFWQQPPGAYQQEGLASTRVVGGGGHIPYLPRQALHLRCTAKLLSCDQILSSHLPRLSGRPSYSSDSYTALLRARRWGQQQRGPETRETRTSSATGSRTRAQQSDCPRPRRVRRALTCENH